MGKKVRKITAPVKAYDNEEFIKGPNGRIVRVISAF